jgi:hypothetical protein
LKEEQDGCEKARLAGGIRRRDCKKEDSKQKENGQGSE